jgi:hypothetical protein
VRLAATLAVGEWQGEVFGAVTPIFTQPNKDAQCNAWNRATKELLDRKLIR